MLSLRESVYKKMPVPCCCLVVTLVWLCSFGSALANPDVARVTEAQADIKIDGRLEEAVWSTLTGFDGMKVVYPDTLETTRYATISKFFYTEKGIYVGVWCEIPRSLQVARLSARDGYGKRDSVGIGIDSSGNGLYGYYFSVSLGGSISDATILPERELTREWDGPWYAKTSAEEEGWFAEIFLPWSMFALPDSEADRTVGIYVSRMVAHVNELWSWPALPRTEPKYLSSFHKVVIAGVDPKKEYAFYPFSSTTRKRVRGETEYKVGADFFWRPSTGLQLTAAVNPDFGQIERDELEINLTAFESYFPEKRPFFLEGQEIFETGRLNLVNTRRIGAANAVPDIPASSHIDDVERAQATDLLGAMKLTGQMGPFRYGVLTAFEDDSTFAVTDPDGGYHVTAEGSDFLVTRLLHEQSNGHYRSFGFLSTLVDHPDKQVKVNAVDGRYRSGDGVWDWATQAIRSDDLDIGYGLTADLTYRPEKGIRHEFEFDWLDEELDLYDLGFLRRNDLKGIQYKYNRHESDIPGLRGRTTEISGGQDYNFDGRLVKSSYTVKRFWQFFNQNDVKLEFKYLPERWDDRNSVGNGDFRIEDRYAVEIGFGTDDVKVWSLFGQFQLINESLGGVTRDAYLSIRYIPTDRINLRLKIKYENKDGWLLHRGGRDFTTYAAEQWRPRLDANIFLSATQQIRTVLQWVGVKAHQQKFYRVPAGDGALIPRVKLPGAASDDFTISHLVFQFRYKWEIAPLSDLYIVYTRGGSIYNAGVDESFSSLLSDTYNDPIAELFVVKLRYRFGG